MLSTLYACTPLGPRIGATVRARNTIWICATWEESAVTVPTLS